MPVDSYINVNDAKRWRRVAYYNSSGDRKYWQRAWYYDSSGNRKLFFTVISGQRAAIVIDASGRDLWKINLITGGATPLGIVPSGLNSPTGLVIDSNEDALILDSSDEIWRVNLSDPDDETGIYGLIGDLPIDLTGPQGLALDTNGDAIIVDTDGDEIWRIDIDNPSFITYGNRGSFPSGLSDARGAGLASNGDFIVLDRDGGEVWRINPLNPLDLSGDYGSLGNLPTGLSSTNANGIAIDSNGDAIVVLQTSNTLWRINLDNPSDTSGDYGNLGSMPSGLGAASGVSIDSNGDAIVVDWSGDDIWRINLSNPSDETGIYGRLGGFPSGLGVANAVGLDSNGDAIVVDTDGTNELWRINLDNPSDTSGDYGRLGSLPSSLESPQALGVNANNDVLLADREDDNLWVLRLSDLSDFTAGEGEYGLLGDLPTALSTPTGISIDSNGDVYVVESDDSLWRINLSDPDSETGDYGLIGTVNSSLVPSGLTLESDEASILIDTSLDEIWRIDIDNPSFVTYGNRGRLPSGVTNIQGVVLDSNGDVIVTDSTGNELWRINPENPSDTSGIYGLIGALPSGITVPNSVGMDANGDFIVANTPSGADSLWRININNPSDETGNYGLIGTLSISISGYALDADGDAIIVAYSGSTSSADFIYRFNLSNLSDTSGDYGLIGRMPSSLTRVSGVAIDSNGDAIVTEQSGFGSLGDSVWRINLSDPDDVTGDYGLIGGLSTELGNNTRGIDIDSEGNAVIIQGIANNLWVVRVEEPSNTSPSEGGYGKLLDFPSTLINATGVGLITLPSITYQDAFIVDDNGDELWRINLENPSDVTGDYGLIGALPSGLSTPSGVGITSNGDLLILDESGRELWRINPANPSDEAGDYGLVGTLPSGLNVPRAIGLLSNGDLIIGHDAGISSSIWRINPANLSDTSGNYGNLGTIPSGLTSFRGLGIDANGDAIVADSSDDDIWRINLSNPSDLSGDYGNLGIVPSGLTSLRGLSLDSNGDALVLDDGDDGVNELWRIDLADPDSIIDNYGLVGYFPSGLVTPRGIAII